MHSWDHVEIVEGTTFAQESEGPPLDDGRAAVGCFRHLVMPGTVEAGVIEESLLEKLMFRQGEEGHSHLILIGFVGQLHKE